MQHGSASASCYIHSIIHYKLHCANYEIQDVTALANCERQHVQWAMYCIPCTESRLYK